VLSLALPRRMRAPLGDAPEAFAPRPSDVLVPFLLSVCASAALVTDYLIAARVAVPKSGS
jgi:hypothetical protein